MGKQIQEKSYIIFSRMTTSSIISSLIVLIFGIILYFLPELTNMIIGIIIGALFVTIGLITLIKYFKRDGAKLYSLNLLFGILLILVGSTSIILPNLASNIITVCSGLYLVLNGAIKVSYGVWFKIGNHSSWFITTMIGILTILLGIIVMFNPFEATKTITEVIGIFLILSSVLDLADTILLKRKTNEIISIFW